MTTTVTIDLKTTPVMVVGWPMDLITAMRRWRGLQSEDWWSSGSVSFSVTMHGDTMMHRDEQYDPVALEHARVVRFMSRCNDAKLLRTSPFYALAAASGGRLPRIEDMVIRDIADKIVAVKLEWATWSEMCELLDFTDAIAKGGWHGDFDSDDHNKIALVKQVVGGSVVMARQGDWIVSDDEGPANAGNNPTAGLMIAEARAAARERASKKKRKGGAK